jgi:hypothetical protein
MTLIGRKIVAVRPMTAAELKGEGWRKNIHGDIFALVLDDGTVIYPACDEEGNGPGALFGCDGQARFSVDGPRRPGRTTTLLGLDATDEEIQKALDALQNESKSPDNMN